MGGALKSKPMFWLAAMAMVAALLAPAIWNGFPLIYPDTGGYLARPLEGTLELNRSALYGAWLWSGMRFDFWPAVAAQSALGVWLVVLTLRAHGLARTPLTALGIVAALAIATSLPWYADTLMPDIFLPYAILASYLLAYCHAELRRFEIVVLVVLVAFAIASHSATLILCLGLLAVLALTPFLPLRLPRPRLMAPALATAAGLLLAPVSNYVIAGEFAFTPGGQTFLFGRMVEDGIVARYLAERCPDASIRLCAYRNAMPDNIDDWLFAPGNPIGELGGWQAYEPEARRLNREMLMLYPGAKLAASAAAAARQFVMLKTEISLNPDFNRPAIEALSQMVPHMMPRLLAARQQASPPFDIDALNILHVAVAAVSILGLIGVLVFAPRWSIAPPLSAFAFIVLTALIGNAIICGTFSSTVDRYQSRLAWLAPFALVVIVLTRRRAAEPGAGNSP